MMKQIFAAMIISGGLVAHALISAPIVMENGQIVNPFTKDVIACNFDKRQCSSLNLRTGERKTWSIMEQS